MNPNLELALALADAADQRTLPPFSTQRFVVETKPDMTPVTNIDRDVEQALTKLLERARPDHAVVGEEFGATGAERASARWIIDPIDGTKNFVRGVPVFATLIALEIDGEPDVGVVSAPALNKRWYASRGDGAFVDGTPIQVSAIGRLEEAQVCYGSISGWDKIGRREGLLQLVGRAWRDRGFGDFWQHVLVAEGAADVALDPEVNLWDLAAVRLIVEEAGGRFTDLSGAVTAAGGSGVSTNGLLHDEVLGLVGG